MNKPGRHHVTAILILLAAAAVSCARSDITRPPRARDGVLDLRGTCFDLRKPVKLNGRWEFHWQKFIDPPAPADGAPAEFIRVPGIWNLHRREGKFLPGRGYASYRLKVLLDEKCGSNGRLAMKVRDMGSAWRLFANGVPVAGAGTVGKDAASSSPAYRPQVFSIAGALVLDLVLHVSNFHHKNGGVWESLHLGAEEDVRLVRENRIIFDIFLAGTILIIGVYSLALFLYRRGDRHLLWFAAFCALFAARVSVTGEYIILNLIPGMPWEMLVRAEYLTFFPGMVFFVMFFGSLFAGSLPAWVRRSVQALGIVFTLIVVATPVFWFTHIIQFFEAATLVIATGLLIILERLRRRRAPDALLFLAGFSVMYAAAVNDILHHNLVVRTGYFAHLGIFSFIVVLAFILSLRYARTIGEQSRARYALLQDRMRPHFLFNALNTVHSLLTRDPGGAERAILSLAGNYRYLTDTSTRSLVPFADEWSFVKDYLDLESLRFRDTLTVSMRECGGCGAFMIPPLTVQPLVENALKHGLKDASGGGTVAVVARREGGRIIVTVTDNGSGLGAGSDRSRTIENIRERFALQGMEPSIGMENAAGGSVIVVLSFLEKRRDGGGGNG